jgi:hypothetical protein
MAVQLPPAPPETCLMPSLDVVELSLRFRWSAVGLMALEPDGRLLLPRLPASAGLYRFLLSSPSGPASLYVGEAEDLRRRMYHYCNPGPSQRTNIRLNGVLREHLINGGTGHVATIEAVEQLLDQRWMPLDLAERPARLLVENAALLAAAAAGLSVHNS